MSDSWKNNDVIVYVATIFGIVVGFGFLASCTKNYLVSPEITQSLEKCKQISSIRVTDLNKGQNISVTIDENMVTVVNKCYETVEKLYPEKVSKIIGD